MRLVETSDTETEIKSPSALEVGGTVGGSAEPACTGSCGGLGLCKKAEAAKELYAF